MVSSNGVQEQGKFTRILANWIGDTSAAMKPRADVQGVPLRPLKLLQKKIDLAAGSNLEIKDLFLVFFLSLFIQDIFHNLTGELVYSEEMNKRKQQLYSEMALVLGEISNAVDQQNSGLIIESCGKLVSAYLNGIKEMDLSWSNENGQKTVLEWRHEKIR